MQFDFPLFIRIRFNHDLKKTRCYPQNFTLYTTWWWKTGSDLKSGVFNLFQHQEIIYPFNKKGTKNQMV